MKQLPGFPIVLHGSSSVPQEYVDIINANGGKLPDAVGIPEEQLRLASKEVNAALFLEISQSGFCAHHKHSAI